MNSNFINDLNVQILLLENELNSQHWNTTAFMEIHQAIFSAKRLKECLMKNKIVDKSNQFLEEKLRQQFKNSSDCYADTHSINASGNFKEGGVIQAMTEDGFIKLLKDVKVIQ